MSEISLYIKLFGQLLKNDMSIVSSCWTQLLCYVPKRLHHSFWATQYLICFRQLRDKLFEETWEKVQTFNDNKFPIASMKICCEDQQFTGWAGYINVCLLKIVYFRCCWWRIVFDYAFYFEVFGLRLLCEFYVQFYCVREFHSRSHKNGHFSNFNSSIPNWAHSFYAIILELGRH